MKSALTALAALAATTPAAWANVDEVEQSYVENAFSGADSEWRRKTANRYSVCGVAGDSDMRRIDLLVDRYQALGEAFAAGDDAAAANAAQLLYRSIKINSRFEECWDTVSRREGVGRDFKRQLQAL